MLSSSRALLCVLILAILAPATVTAAEMGFNFYGLSYHLDRKAAKSLKFNEVNLGFGLSANLVTTGPATFFLDGGFFKDTFRKASGYVTGGCRLNVAGGLYAGAMAGVYASPSVNDGEGVFILVPTVSYRFGMLSLNAVYMPEHEPVNRFSWYGLYVTIYGSKAKAKKE